MSETDGVHCADLAIQRAAFGLAPGTHFVRVSDAKGVPGRALVEVLPGPIGFTEAAALECGDYLHLLQRRRI